MSINESNNLRKEDSLWQKREPDHIVIHTGRESR